MSFSLFSLESSRFLPTYARPSPGPTLLTTGTGRGSLYQTINDPVYLYNRSSVVQDGGQGEPPNLRGGLPWPYGVSASISYLFCLTSHSLPLFYS